MAEKIKVDDVVILAVQVKNLREENLKLKEQLLQQNKNLLDLQVELETLKAANVKTENDKLVEKYKLPQKAKYSRDDAGTWFQETD